MRSATFIPLVALAGACTDGRSIEGPARYCGYSAVIDLRAGESIEILSAGIHQGKADWTGNFGKLGIVEHGWSNVPTEKKIPRALDTGYPLYRSERSYGEHVVAIWNQKNGRADFVSARPLTMKHYEAIDRVRLIDEGSARPENCDLNARPDWDS